MTPSEHFSPHIGVNTLFHVPGDIGGSETYLREMLVAIVQKFPELRLTLFTSLDNDVLMSKLFAAYPNVENRCLPFRAANRPLRIVLEQFWLPLAVWRSNVEVLWSPGYTAPFWAPCPQVVTIHDLQYKSHPDDLSWLEKATLDILVRMACKRCAKIIAVSQFSKSEIAKYGFAPDDKISAIHEGVDPSFAEAVQIPAVVDELQKIFASARPFILCVAHTYPHKNVHLLIEAFSLICDEIPHNLVIVGKERLGETVVRESVKRLPRPDRLFRLNEGVSFGALKFLYQNADAFVLPSAYEGFGLPVLEAMMAGAPVVTSTMASLPEVAGKHTFYFQSDDEISLGQQIRAVIEMEPEKKAIWCEQAKSWAKKFTWEKAALETVDIFSTCRK